jgi:hypothetical protein
LLFPQVSERLLGILLPNPLLTGLNHLLRNSLHLLSRTLSVGIAAIVAERLIALTDHPHL